MTICAIYLVKLIKLECMLFVLFRRYASLLCLGCLVGLMLFVCVIVCYVVSLCVCLGRRQNIADNVSMLY